MIHSADNYDSTHYAVGYATAPALLGPWTKAAESPILRSTEAFAGPATRTSSGSPTAW